MHTPIFIKNKLSNTKCVLYCEKSNIFIYKQSLTLVASSDWHLPNNIPSRSHDHELEEESDVLVADPQVKKPPMYAVVLHNDDYTPMEFVVQVLQQMFGHNHEKAMDIMLSVHHKGKGVAGIYPRDIAETKAQMVNKEARLAGHPLLSQIEPMQEN